MSWEPYQQLLNITSTHIPLTNLSHVTRGLGHVWMNGARDTEQMENSHWASYQTRSYEIRIVQIDSCSQSLRENIGLVQSSMDSCDEGNQLLPMMCLDPSLSTMPGDSRCFSNHRSQCGKSWGSLIISQVLNTRLLARPEEKLVSASQVINSKLSKQGCTQTLPHYIVIVWVPWLQQVKSWCFLNHAA